jgi:hypothetical protein
MQAIRKMIPVLAAVIIAAMIYGCAAQPEESAQAPSAAQDTAPATEAALAPADDGYLLRYYENSGLGFGIHIIDGWEAAEQEGSVTFTPPENVYGGGVQMLSVAFFDDGPLELAILDIDTIVERMMNDAGGSGAVVKQAGSVRLSHVDAYAVEFETEEPDGGKLTTNLYMVDSGDGGRYHIYYTRDADTDGGFINAAEDTLESFTLLNGQEQPVQAQQEPATDRDKIDFMMLAGESTPDDIAAMYGEPPEQDSGEIGGREYLYYIYSNMLVSFTPDSGGEYRVDGVDIYQPESPVTVGGVVVSYTYGQADAALKKNGYEFDPELEDMYGALYYTGGENGREKAVLLYLEDGKVTEAEGWYGPSAEFILSLAG